mmetsp:Transcript_46393/g.99139  ORF Transcript_46393/g.99139 Transcript_46393/m.99139 type:complete len:619 (-) Transcript_46393:217-2073(-)
MAAELQETEDGNQHSIGVTGSWDSAPDLNPEGDAFAGAYQGQEDGDELQQALAASLEAYEEEQLRMACEESAGPPVWSQAPPPRAEEPAWHCDSSISDPAFAKDLADLPPSLLAKTREQQLAPPSKRARSASWSSNGSGRPEPDARPLPEHEAADLWQVLFGAAAEAEDVDRWLRSGFAFVDAEAASLTSSPAAAPPACPWGLRQELGGPCGILAAVQAFIIRELLWGGAVSEDVGDEAFSQVSTAAGNESDTDPSPASRDGCSSYCCGASPSPTGSPLPSAEAVTASGAEEALGAPGDVGEGAAMDLDVALAGARAATALATTLAERFHRVEARELLACALARILYTAAPSSSYIWAEVVGHCLMSTREFTSAQALAEWLTATGALEASPCGVLSFACSLVLTRGIDVIRQDMDDPSAPLVGVFGHCSQELVNLCLAGRAVTNVFDGSVTFEDGGDVLTLQGICQRPICGFLSALEPLKLCEVGALLKQPQYPLWVVGTQTHYSLLLSAECHVNQVATGSSGAAADAAARGAPAALLHFNGRDFGADRPALSAVELRLQEEGETLSAPPLLSGDEDARLFAEVLRTRWPGAGVSFPGLLHGTGEGAVVGAGLPPRID